MNNNLERARAYICQNRPKYPTSFCCFGPTGPTDTYKSVSEYF